MSMITGSTFSPASRSASCCLRTPARTWNPRRASSWAVARPMPEDAPVTTAILLALIIVDSLLRLLTHHCERTGKAPAGVLRLVVESPHERPEVGAGGPGSRGKAPPKP